MAYLETKESMKATSGVCRECGSTNTVTTRGDVYCTNCGSLIVPSVAKRRKQKSINTVANSGRKHDSIFERTIDDELESLVLAGKIKGYESSYTVEIPVYSRDGTVLFTVRHKVDYRIHHVDDSFELYEVKGHESTDWKWRRRLLETVWITEHKDHTYTVRKASFHMRER